ncbi:16S rRNA (guanine(527)-N(7))-methyltransferase RsmG [candidate division TA06 bacterium]|uniref:Ribosomal RNA small subunit methyltransferase G n=1 Tax=candidate division TA06 bacterium TaxID=2250710 RepID=A0A660SN02_UNCT6|nr:MAG: 16S rRNA (guanine(527)-N(7))-methyltransferase RsmG [candidate division TA06 bacterium]
MEYILPSSFNNVSRETLLKLEEYQKMVLKKNRSINLFSSKDVHIFWERHILDSIKSNEYIKGHKRVCDIGSGGGMPGIPLAIINSNIKFFLFERRDKKSDFLLNIKEELVLRNVFIVNANFIDYKSEKYDLFLSRAVKLTDSILNHANLLSKGEKSLYIYYFGNNFDYNNINCKFKHRVDRKNKLLIFYLL